MSAPALWIAKTGLDAQQTRMSVTSNNLANVNTTGFKRDRAVFEDLVYQNYKQVGAANNQDDEIPTGLNVGTGVRVTATEKHHTQGNMLQTDNALDVAIKGRGFFQILQPDGNTAYTRAGDFTLNSNGEVVTPNGQPLEPGIVVPEGAKSITIGQDGTVSAQLAGDAEPVQLGNIQLADFVNPSGLQPIGENLFVESGASGAPQLTEPGLNGVGALQQGALESSNVNVVEELVNMIETQRSYEMNSKSISTTDQMLQYLNQNV